MKQQKVIFVAGPTAAGKSALALELARKAPATIINADAMQVYAGLPILTAQPGEMERQQAPHELYGVLDPHERSSAGKWLELAREAIQKALTAGRMPILVGGTGLYFHALCGGLADIPPVPETMRAEVQKLYMESGETEFRRALAKLDPESAARLAKNDRQRLVRAYEVARHTGKTLSEWHAGTGDRGQGDLNPSPVPCSLSPETHLMLPPRDELYAACDRRFAAMVERGAVEEARAFLARGLDPTMPAMKTIGLREIGAYLNGEITLDQAIAKAQQATRNYAKRQTTWFRHRWPF